MLAEVVGLLESARRASARVVNAIMTATYWKVGQRIVEFEQRGKERAKYGEQLLERLSDDLTARFGRGFSVDNLELMRRFYHAYQSGQISETLSRNSEPTVISETQPRKLEIGDLAKVFPLPWSHYVRLLSVEKPEARKFYEEEALRGGWPVRQLDRQVSSLFYERTLLSRKKAAMLRKGAVPQPGELPTPEEEIKDPFVLEFLSLKDEYSESDIEAALIDKLEEFLLELGGDFTFVGRQRRLRIGDEWYRVDLVFFHRILRCLVVIDLKAGKFTHADAGQMHVYLNYARKHWMRPGENPPVGLILCSEKDAALVQYALEGLPNKVLAAEYKTKLPDEKLLAAELEKTRKTLEQRGQLATSLKRVGPPRTGTR
jgi:predicted nuclease of restriction endonuclease-like (RecB) superfamily